MTEPHAAGRLFPGEHPDHLVRRARAEHAPIASFCLFSGGGDSAVLAHRCREHYDKLVFIDTGTALPGVREHVENFAAWLGRDLLVYESGDAFRRLVLDGLGFPGPAQHGRAYTRLKERQIEALLRDAKQNHPRSARVMFLTGVRRAESQRRATRMPITRRGGALFVNPMIDWTDAAMAEYRYVHGLPESDVAALIHRSGECNCGCYAAPGEREMLRSLWPDWFQATIGDLEDRAAELGLAACRWGERPPDGTPTGPPPGPLCSDCQLRLEVAA